MHKRRCPAACRWDRRTGLVLCASVGGVLFVAIAAAFMCSNSRATTSLAFASPRHQFAHPHMRMLLDAADPYRDAGYFPVKDKFTLIMLFYNRPNHLVWTVPQLLKLDDLHTLHIRINSGHDTVPAETLTMAQQDPRLKITYCEHNSMNNRFLMPEDMETEWVFNIDDDIEFNADEIAWAFQVAREFPAQVTGFYPRWLKYSKKKKYVGGRQVVRVCVHTTSLTSLHSQPVHSRLSLSLSRSCSLALALSLSRSLALALSLSLSLSPGATCRTSPTNPLKARDTTPSCLVVARSTMLGGCTCTPQSWTTGCETWWTPLVTVMTSLSTCSWPACMVCHLCTWLAPSIRQTPSLRPRVTTRA